MGVNKSKRQMPLNNSLLPTSALTRAAAEQARYAPEVVHEY